MKLSRRDIVLLVGIVVAVVVAATTVAYQGKPGAVHRNETSAPKKTSLNDTATSVLKNFVGRVQSRF